MDLYNNVNGESIRYYSNDEEIRSENEVKRIFSALHQSSIREHDKEGYGIKRLTSMTSELLPTTFWVLSKIPH